jgi:hypothetical protein
MAIYRILVLGATFFMVGLCPRLDMALAVSILGIAVFSFLWIWEVWPHEKKR